MAAYSCFEQHTTCDVKNVFGFWVFLLHQSKSEGLVLSAPLQFLCFSLLSIILADLLGNRILLQQVQKPIVFGGF